MKIKENSNPKKFIDAIIYLKKNNKGDAFGILLLGTIATLVIIVILFNMLDYALFSYKKKIISQGIDYSVSSAIQEIESTNNINLQSEVLEDGSVKESQTSFISINESNADKEFFKTFYSNTGIEKSKIEDYVMIIIINPINNGLNYIIKKNLNREEGYIDGYEKIESIINTKINEFFQKSEYNDKNTIFVNKNPKTNEFKTRPYYMVFIKDYQINGLFRKNFATFIGFSASKVEIKKQK